MNEDDVPTPLPIVHAEDQDAWAEQFEDGQATPETPFGAALLWWQGLSDPVEYRYALEQLSLKPEVWGDYTQAAEAIAELSIMTVPIVIDEGNIVAIKFIDYGGEGVGRAFEEAPLEDIWIVTLVKPASSTWWLVWGLSHNHVPGADEVYE